MHETELNADHFNRICEMQLTAENRASYGTDNKGFRDLRVWQAGMDLVETCYKCSAAFPASEQFGLTTQLRRAAVSITANIAEGWGRNTQPEFRRFVDISSGSLC